MSYNKFSEIRDRLLTGENNHGLLLDSHISTQQKMEEETLLVESEKQYQLQQVEKENELKRQQEIIQKQKEDEIRLTEIENQKQIQQVEKENELKRQQEIIQKQKEDEIRLIEIENQKHIQQVEEENELKRQQEIIQKQKEDETRLTEIENQKQIQQVEKENKLKRQQEVIQQQKEEETRLAESEKQKHIQLKKTPENINNKKTISIHNNNKVNYHSTLKTSLISILASIFICGIAFFIYKQYFEEDSIRDAKIAFSYIKNQNSKYYKEKEKIYKEFLKSFANSNTYNSETNVKLQNDLIALENENKQNSLETNNAINELRNLYSLKKGSLADFDYAFASYKGAFVNHDSIDILPLEQKVQKLISTFVETHFLNDSKIKSDLVGKDITGWGEIEANQITSILSNIEKRNNATICIASLSLEKNAVKSNAEVTIHYNDTTLISVTTNKITYKNIATPNSWFTFTPVAGCAIYVNTNNNPIQLKTCENCSVIKINTNTETVQKLTNHPETIYITSDTNFDAVVDFTYIPEK